MPLEWNFAQVWETVAETVPGAIAQVHGERRCDWRTFDRRADGVAARLLAAGLARHDKVALYLYNTPEYLETAFMELSAFLALGKVMPPPSRTRPQNPLMNSYRAADGKWLWLIGAEAERHWTPIVKALGATELLDDERFKTSRDRRRNAEALVGIFDDIFARHTRDEWAAILVRHDVWWAPVSSFEDLVNDAQAQACGAFVEMPSMAGDGTTQTTLATPVDFGAEPVAPPAVPPQLGSDTGSVLRDMGVDDQEIARLREARVVV